MTNKLVTTPINVTQYELNKVMDFGGNLWRKYNKIRIYLELVNPLFIGLKVDDTQECKDILKALDTGYIDLYNEKHLLCTKGTKKATKELAKMIEKAVKN